MRLLHLVLNGFIGFASFRCQHPGDLRTEFCDYPLQIPTLGLLAKQTSQLRQKVLCVRMTSPPQAMPHVQNR